MAELITGDAGESAPPVAHNFALGCPGVLGTLHAGGTVVFAPNRSPPEVFPIIERERVTITALVPPLALLWMMTTQWVPADLSSLRVLQVGGAKLGAEPASRVRRTLGCQLQQVFGIAEGLLNYTRLADPEDIVVSTQGRPLSPADEIRIVDEQIVDEQGVDVEPGQVGELLTRGPYTLAVPDERLEIIGNPPPRRIVMTMLRYVSAVVPVMSDPCHVMTRLAQTARSDTYVVYEKPPVWTFAAGSIADVVVTCSRTTFRDHRGEQVVDRDPQQLAEVPRLLAQVDLPDWRAYGIATFELSYDHGERKEADGDAVLLRLAVPEVEVRIADGRAVVRGIRRDEVTALAEFVSQPVDQPRYQATPVDVEAAQGAGYRRTVRDVLRRIRAGRLQKVVLSRTVSLDADVDLFGTFALGRRRNTPARSFLISFDGLRAAGFSPEMVVKVSADGQVLTQPLAGTRALMPDDAEHSERLRADLLGDAKEVFEHMISVRAAHDDLTVVCRPESVAITEFMAVKPRGTVQHLGSSVIGELSDGHGPWDAFTAVFPAVTVTGTPKPEACKCIQEYEENPRGLYGGAVLAVDSDGGLDATLVLRALFQQHGRTWLRAGAGIVAQSDPDREFEETCEKLRSVALNVVTKDNGGATPLDRRRLRDDIAAEVNATKAAPREVIPGTGV